ncbi:beta-ketoacyl-[acyl-carrier-protein] synthase family protein [Streptomyces sp. 7N604]|uniref:beta-ketoacyl-[acyl-carrier-protein] synthase family protein n=1 Tax=Streptomyces sp. 7N604 TaxID=3457415 RepID=UPI003FD5F119
MTPVVITGLGVVCCLGDTVAELWDGLLRAAHLPVPAPDNHGTGDRPNVYRVSTGCAGTEPPLGRSGPLGRASAMASSAVGQAVADAGLAPEHRTDAALTVGTTLGDIDLAESGEVDQSDQSASSYVVAAEVAQEHGLGGPNQSLSTACSAGVYAVSWGAELIRDGRADVVIACGTDGYSRVALAALDRFGLLDRQLCRPFDTGRQGMVTGEGAAAVVLESADHARRRGAPAYAVLEGDGWSCDAYHPTAPEPDGGQLHRAVTTALDRSGGPPGAAVLHRAGIEVNDEVESEVIATALGAGAAAVPAYAIKAVIGHTAGAAGVFGCVAAALILRHHAVPPNAHVSDPDPRCRLDVPVDGPTPLAEPRVVVSATGFGGNNAALVLGAAV